MWVHGAINRGFDLGVFWVALAAAIVAHEVRNPLAGVRAGLQLFERLPPLSTDERRIVRQMMERLDLLNAHISALVHFARPRSPAMSEVAIASLLNEIVQSIRETDACSRVRFEIQGLDLPVLGDVAMLREVFDQLLLNAADAQSRAGTILVTVTETGNSVDVRIADRGSGIPTALQERIFEPLFTPKRSTSACDRRNAPVRAAPWRRDCSSASAREHSGF